MIAKELLGTSRVLFGILMVVVVSCGTPAATPTPDPEPTPAEITQPTPSPGETPIAQPTPTSPPPAAVIPSGNLNIGQKELGAFAGHPRLTINPALFVNSTIPIGESLVTTDVDGNLEVPLLAESWSVSADFLTWTFKLREGVQFHKDYGEMTAEDVVWSYQEWAQNDVHAGASVIKDFWQHPDGYAEATGRYTVEVNTGAPVPDLLALVHMAIPSGRATWVTSKTQSEELGSEAANRDIAATGPWEIVEHRTAQFWKMRAVEDHWRKTPHFQELVFWEIPEESSLLAGFQTGELDTYVMAFDSIPLVETVPEAKVMSIPGAGTQFLTFYGQYYVGLGTEDQRAGYNPDLPFVSSNPDPDSLEWEHARMVREALLIAIDRRALIDTLLGGFARPSPAAIYDWVGNEHLLEPYTPWEHDPDRASELLAEAGYSEGFQITLTPAIRGAPAEAEVCEAIAAMWGDIGVDVNFQRVPYGTLRPSLASRTYQGATCHGGAGRVTPSQGYVLFHTSGGSSFGVEHPWLEGRISQAFQAVDPAERDQLDREIGQFFADNLLTNIALYRFDAVWPVGPRIEEWPQDVKGLDLRNINGYEFIRPRQ